MEWQTDRPSAKIQMIIPNFLFSEWGCLTSAVQWSILWARGLSGEHGIIAKTQCTNPQDSVAALHSDATHLLMCLWCKTLCPDLVSSRLGWNLPCVANTVGCWQVAQVWAIGRLLGRSSMSCYCGATVSHGSACSMWLWRTNLWMHYSNLEASYDVNLHLWAPHMLCDIQDLHIDSVHSFNMRLW